jgi:H+/Cl- antiporter ClcA
MSAQSPGVEAESSQKLVLTLLISIIVGAVAAVVASLFLFGVEEGQKLLFHHLPEMFGFEQAPWWWAGILLTVAAALVLLARRMPGATGSSPLTGFHFDTPLVNTASVVLAAAASLIGGFALGPEAPLIVLGTAIGAIIARKRDEKTRKALMFIGGAAAIGAVFGNPFITGFMILEFVALGLAPAALLVPVFTALASSYLVSLGIWSLPGVGVHSLAVPGLPEYTQIEPGDLLAGAAVAVVAGLVALIARDGAVWVDRLFQKRQAPVLFGAAALTTLMLLIGETVFSVNQNQILFSGNSGMPELIAQTSVATVLFILVAKGIAYAAAMGGGLRGGPIFPATFLGVAVAVLGSLVFPDANVSALAAAGIAGSAAAFLKLPATSALLGALLISSAGAAVAPFAIFGAVVGFVVRVLNDASVRRTRPAEGLDATHAKS